LALRGVDLRVLARSFTTIPIFPLWEAGAAKLAWIDVLSDRRNVVLIADGAHRGQYAFIEGFARHMRDALPHTLFIGVTGAHDRPHHRLSARGRGRLPRGQRLPALPLLGEA
jgi:hypothetical protein